jgi:Ala-tRNA(Pro) deacylase
MRSPPLTPDQLFARLDALGIAHKTYNHPPVFTVAEAVQLPGGHCKSLFLKDKKGALWLVVALEESRVDLKRLADRLAAPRFSFGNADLLYEALGVRPGSVTPFALANDSDHRVTVVLDGAMLGHDPLNYHPLENDRTTAVAPADLLRFIAACGHTPAHCRPRSSRAIKRAVIASPRVATSRRPRTGSAKQSRVVQFSADRDCFVAALLAMTTGGGGACHRRAMPPCLA